MATQTTRLGLRKPDPDPTTGDSVDVETDINENMDKVDAAVGFTICTSGTRPVGADRWPGRAILETDTGKAYVWRADDSTWRQIAIATSAIAMAIDVNPTVLTGDANALCQFFFGSGTWNKGSSTRTVRVQVQGSGAAGAGAAITPAGQTSCGGGGAAGTYCERWFAADDLASSEPVVVGTGGVGVAGASGGVGAVSSFSAAATLVSAPGGSAAGVLGAGVSPGFGTGGPDAGSGTGAFRVRGGAGQNSIRVGVGVGQAAGGNGGNSPLGTGGRGGIGNSSGTTGSMGGGGGGAANDPSQSARAGSNGGEGIVIVTQFF